MSKKNKARRGGLIEKRKEEPKVEYPSFIGPPRYNWWCLTDEAEAEWRRTHRVRQTYYVRLMVPMGKIKPGLFVPVSEGWDWYLHPSGVYIEKAFCEEERVY